MRVKLSAHTRIILGTGLFLLLVIPHEADTQYFIGETEVELRDVITDIRVPWEILWGPDNHIWYTERDGRVNRLNPETSENELLLTIPEVHQETESGLLGMALHPDFSANPFVYLVYTYIENNAIKERIVQYSYIDNSLDNPEILLENITGATNHDGSRILTGPDQKLYITTGDAIDVSLSQDTSKLNGKVLRMNFDGSIPGDNPFPDSYVWSVGHRNAQGLVFSPGGILYSSEHGPSNDDEVNIIEKGRNYGWPEVQGFCDLPSENEYCDAHSIATPLAAWTPTLAVCGLDYYSQSAIPEWTNHLLMVTLRNRNLVSLELSADGLQITAQTDWFNYEFGRLRDLCIAPDGRVFMATSNHDGRGTPADTDDRIIEIKALGTPATIGDTNHKHIRVIPNPMVETTQIHFDENFTQGTLYIYSLSGSLAFQSEIQGTRFTLHRDKLLPGVYTIIVVSPAATYEHSLVVR